MTTRTLLLIGIALFIGVYAADYPLSAANNWQTFIGAQADAPYRYRVLTSSAILGAASLFGTPNIASVYYMSIVGQFVGAFALVFALDVWLRQWHTPERALIGVGLVALPIALMSRYPVVNPYSLVEAALFCIGARLIFQRRHRALWLIIALALLNRETGVFLVLLYALVGRDCWSERWYWHWLGLYSLTFAVVYGGLRLLLGAAPDAITVQMVVYRNLRDAPLWAGLVLPYLPFAVLALKGARRFQDGRAVLLTAGGYLALACVFGLLHETRLFLTPLALTMPLILRGFRP